MAYNSGQFHTIPEYASKLNHVDIAKSEWTKSLLDNFEIDDVMDEANYDNNIWAEYNLNDINCEPLEHIWVVDGSFAQVYNKNKELAYVKTALLTIDENKIDNVDIGNPHPMILQDLMRDSALHHITVLPLKNIHSKLGNLYDTVRHVIYDSLKLQDEGIFYETYKWLLFKKWRNISNNSPSFFCPCCNKMIEGFRYDEDEMECPYCHQQVLLTDVLGLHLDMGDDFAKLKVVTSYMTIVEHLMLFMVIKHNWYYSDKNLLSNTLYIKDGPLVLGGQYSKMVPLIRDLFEYSKEIRRPIHVIGVEKSGEFFDYLSIISKFNSVDNNKIKCAVLTHDYIRKNIKQVGKFDPSQFSPYGERTNWGEKAFVMVDNHTHFVLNLVTGKYNDDDQHPCDKDVIGLDRIIKTLPRIISSKYDGALYPVELANSIASLSNYPSTKVLERFTADMLKK